MILQIGNTAGTSYYDVSDYVQTGYKVSVTPVYDNDGFTATDGTTYKTKLGEKIRVKATLGCVPNALAYALMTICRNDEVAVSFGAPIVQTATFFEPTVTAEMILEDEAWDISIDMETDVLGGA